MPDEKFPDSLAGAEISDIDLNKEEFTFLGERLTEKRAEKLAEKHFERSQNLIPGGKSLSGGGKHSPIVQTRVPETTMADLQQIAAAHGWTVSRVLRRAIDELVDRELGLTK